MTDMQRKSAKEIKDEYEDRVRELADQTPGWAHGQGCYRDEESGEVMGYFIVSPQTKKNRHKPNWLEWSGETSDVWSDVLDVMYSQGVSICYKAFNGHYIGLPGEQGSKVGTSLNNVFTRATTALRHVEYLLTQGQFEMATEYINKRLGAGFAEDVEVERLLFSLDKFLSEVSNHQKSLFLFMLTSGRDTDSPDETA